MLLKINNEIHAKYDKIKDPWRMLSFMSVAGTGIFFTAFDSTALFGITWLLGMIASRLIYMTTP